MRRALIRASLALCLSSGLVSANDSDKILVGIQEQVSLKGLTFDAKVDTGATNSSVHAVDIGYLDKQGQRYVRFSTIDSSGTEAHLELPLLRIARIKQHTGTRSQERPVIEVSICMGSVSKLVQVSLTDRSRFSYPFLVGASFLDKDFVVDVSQENLTQPDCAPAERQP